MDSKKGRWTHHRQFLLFQTGPKLVIVHMNDIQEESGQRSSKFNDLPEILDGRDGRKSLVAAPGMVGSKMGRWMIKGSSYCCRQVQSLL